MQPSSLHARASGVLISVFLRCSGLPSGAGAVRVGGLRLPVEPVVRGDHADRAVRPGRSSGEQRVPGHVPLRRVPWRPVRLQRAARRRTGLPLPALEALAALLGAAGGNKWAHHVVHRVEACCFDLV